MKNTEQEFAKAKETGQTADAEEIARQILHRLVSSTNRRMHKGFPEMLSYLLEKPMEYSSHAFVNIVVDKVMPKYVGVLILVWSPNRSTMAAVQTNTI